MRAATYARILLTTLCLLALTPPVAWAGQGWYLMLPPLDGRGAVMPKAPLPGWLQVDSFDSATECKASQVRKGNEAEEMQRRFEKQKDLPKSKFFAETWAQYQLGLCIASDDPRLGTKR